MVSGLQMFEELTLISRLPQASGMNGGLYLVSGLQMVNKLTLIQWLELQWISDMYLVIIRLQQLVCRQ